MLIGAGLYLIGVIGLTIAYHVPLNDDLARLDPNASDTAARWSDYLSNWTRWNHVRAAAGIGAAVAFVAALLD